MFDRVSRTLEQCGPTWVSGQSDETPGVANEVSTSVDVRAVRRRRRRVRDKRVIQCVLAWGLVWASVCVSAVAADKMYWSDRGSNTVRRADLDGSNVQTLVSGLGQARGIAIDVQNNMLYWADNGTNKIQRSLIDGSKIEDLVTNLGFPAGIALDVAGGKMYWADTDRQKIQRANLDGSNVVDLISALRDPYYLALDLDHNHIYWTDYGSRKIQRADLDGSNVVDLVSAGLELPRGIALDLNGGKMYWTDRQTDKIQRANLDGTSIETLRNITPPSAAPHGIALDLGRGHMYWVDNGLVTIERANLDGTGATVILDSSSGFLRTPWEIRLDLRGNSVCPPGSQCTPASAAERIDALTSAIRAGSNDPTFDLNRDGQVGENDRRFLIEFVLNTTFGDSNLDGRFDSSDLVSVYQAGLFEKNDQNARWSSGDWNGDFNFATSDLVSAFTVGSYETQANVNFVPEPKSTAALSVTSFWIAIACLRRRYPASRMNTEFDFTTSG
jgi:low density lipoprotein receptor-related protein 5/6